MRTFLAVSAVAGLIGIVLGIVFAITWLALIGATLLTVALVMTALAAPKTRGGRW
ncbi:hypothetical protein [Paractinoplanes rishiriensis]|uniref:Uncharacterized protein n=1 Tax=Paractinoplanes rishiriensis TaxID=1050105 RepID=A0A919MVA9_9ACTN|nr:hypothetical protein [Actinoplanes rishiriensis]GIF01212.1 hypothetical protein Ari01nite_86760 [Actinoplanes rishiriensis]